MVFTNRRIIACTFVSIFALHTHPGFAAEVTASDETVRQLQTMNDADCATSKSHNWNAYAGTLATEYQEIDADGKKQDRAAVLAGLKAVSADSMVTACSTRVSKVTRDGELYHLYGEYSEEGILDSKHPPYRIVERIRDTWKRVNGKWQQTESLAYETTIWVSGKPIEHHVLPKEFF